MAREVDNRNPWGVTSRRQSKRPARPLKVKGSKVSRPKRKNRNKVKVNLTAVDFDAGKNIADNYKVNIMIVNGGISDYPWIDKCIKAIRRFTQVDYTLHIFDYNDEVKCHGANCIIRTPSPDFEQYKKSIRKSPNDYISLPHQAGMSYLAKFISSGYMICLDSDALPMKSGWAKFMIGNAKSNGIAGVQRRLRHGSHLIHEPIAHPAGLCFSYPVYKALNTNFIHNKATGQNITDIARRQGRPICYIRRSNDFGGLRNLPGSGPAMFSLHGSFLYHHGCGSRMTKKGPIATVGVRTWPQWVLDLDKKAKDLLDKDFDKFITFIREGKK
jgi:hypothetical protein